MPVREDCTKRRLGGRALTRSPSTAARTAACRADAAGSPVRPSTGGEPLRAVSPPPTPLYPHARSRLDVGCRRPSARGRGCSTTGAVSLDSVNGQLLSRPVVIAGVNARRLPSLNSSERLIDAKPRASAARFATTVLVAASAAPTTSAPGRCFIACFAREAVAQVPRQCASVSTEGDALLIRAVMEVPSHPGGRWAALSIVIPRQPRPRRRALRRS